LIFAFAGGASKSDNKKMPSQLKNPIKKITIPNQQKDVDGITISFRTMPKDMEFLLSGGRDPQPVREKMPAALPAPTKPETEKQNLPQIFPPTEKFAPADAMINGKNQSADADKFITKLARQDMKPEKELEEIKIKKEKKLQEEERKKETKTLYKEASHLYKHKLYKEAQEKLSRLLELSPGHWRAKWLSSRTIKKISRQQTAPPKSEEVSPKKDPAISNQLQIKDEEKEKIEDLLIKEAKYAQQIEKELAQSREEKLTAEEEARKAKEALKEINAENQGQTKEGLDEQLKQEEEQIKKLQDEKIKAEKDLAALKSNNLALEQQITQTKELLLAREQEAELEARRENERLMQEEMKRQEELAALEKEISEKESSQQSPVPQNYELYPNASAQQEPIYAEPASMPAQPIQTGESSSLISFEHILEKIRSLGTFKKITVSLLAIAIVSISLIYLIGLWQTSPKPQETTENTGVSEQILPASLFSAETDETIVLQTGQKKNLSQEINNLTAKTFTPGSFTRILVEVASGQTQEKNYISLPDLIDSLRISFPAAILSNIGDTYTLFLYSQKQTPTGPFLEGLGKNKLGIVISVKNGDNLNQQFSNWEKTMPDDLDALFLGKKISFLTNYNFQDIPHKDAVIRSLDLPNEFSSMNYCFYNNKILITTSLESMQSLINRMAPQ
jgi:hypothetical protein